LLPPAFLDFFLNLADFLHCAWARGKCMVFTRQFPLSTRQSLYGICPKTHHFLTSALDEVEKKVDFSRVKSK